MSSKDSEIGNLFSLKLKFYMDEKNIKSPELGKKLGVTSASIRHYYNGERFPRDIVKIADIADILGVSLADLLPFTLKEKQKLIKNALTENIEDYIEYIPKDLLPQSIKSIPLINGTVGAGDFSTNEEREIIDKIYVDIHNIEKAYRSQEIQAIRISGDSMLPYVKNNDIALFYTYKNGESPNADGKYIINTSQGEQIKNIKFMLNGDIRIISENPSYHTKDGYDEEIKKESQEYLKIIGKVVGRILKD